MYNDICIFVYLKQLQILTLLQRIPKCVIRSYLCVKNYNYVVLLCVCICVCVCAHAHMQVCAYILAYVLEDGCVCVCVHAHMQVCAYILAYVLEDGCVCVRACTVHMQVCAHTWYVGFWPLLYCSCYQNCKQCIGTLLYVRAFASHFLLEAHVMFCTSGISCANTPCVYG